MYSNYSHIVMFSHFTIRCIDVESIANTRKKGNLTSLMLCLQNICRIHLSIFFFCSGSYNFGAVYPFTEELSLHLWLLLCIKHCYISKWWTVGLDDLGHLFQTRLFYDSKAICQMSVIRKSLTQSSPTYGEAVP